MSNFEWQEVKSSNIDAIAYDEDEKELHVRFKSGAEYVYFDVSPVVFQGLKDADSKGKYLNEHIKSFCECQRSV